MGDSVMSKSLMPPSLRVTLGRTKGRETGVDPSPDPLNPEPGRRLGMPFRGAIDWRDWLIKGKN